jgi:hypothetical protein
MCDYGEERGGAAQVAMQLLLTLRDAVAQSDDHDADQVNIQLKIVTAWIKWAEGDRSQAVREMRAGRCSRRCTAKSPVSPGSIAPAPEMLGDMLLLEKEPKLALAAYEWHGNLPRTPQSRIRRRRFRPGGRTSPNAEQHYRRLLTSCGHADSDLPELGRARLFFGKD